MSAVIHRPIATHAPHTHSHTHTHLPRRRWAPSIRVVQYKGTPSARKEIVAEHLRTGGPIRFNVLLTTYEFVMRDKAALRKPHWQYIIIDEGHRLKNAHCRFAATLGTEYTSRNRLLLTGTPLQNSLPELWSLLNFLLPKVFASADSFEAWFAQPFSRFRSGGAGDDGSAGGVAALSREETMLVINRLHAVLRPFLLRRLKSAVLSQLPEKTEHVLRCGLSAWQRTIYTQIQRYGAVAAWPGASTPEGATRHAMTGLSNLFMQLRKAVNHPYLFLPGVAPLKRDDGGGAAGDERLRRAAAREAGERLSDDDEEDDGGEDSDAPPVGQYVIQDPDELWRSSGKFDLLDRMLPKLQKTGELLACSRARRASV